MSPRSIVLCTAVIAVALVLAPHTRADRPAATPVQLGHGLAGQGELVGNTPRRILHFTFDDGPHERETPRLLDALDRFGVKATFFFSASRFASGEKRNARASEIARQVAARGHAIGSHSFDHVPMARLSPPELREQLARADAMFERVFGARPHIFRPPKGSRNNALRAMLKERRDTTVMWNVGLADWVKRPAREVRETFFKILSRNETRDGDRGGIVLLHDTHSWSVDAFVLIMEALRARNCELMASGEELYEVVDSLEPWVGKGALARAKAPDAKRQRTLRARLVQRCSGSSSKSARVMP